MERRIGLLAVTALLLVVVADASPAPGHVSIGTPVDATCYFDNPPIPAMSTKA